MTRSGWSHHETRLRPPEPVWSDPEAPDPHVVGELAAALRLPKLVCSVLSSRGITAVDEAKRFLRPRLEDLHDPGLLADGALAAERIALAIASRETIFVHGDYDVDGVCATSLLARWFGSLGGRVVPFVPHRLRDGYDFSGAGLAAARAAGASLVVTADCGTLAHETVRGCRHAGIDVVVTDHHTVGAELPEATAVVNPRRPDCRYPEKGLCGTAVAYKLCELVSYAMRESGGDLTEYLDLVALATVADLVPLTGENRVLVSYGLRRFAHSRVKGIAALLDVSGVPRNAVTAGKLGFVIAPRINAVGRIGESEDAVRLLLTNSDREARVLAERLDEANRIRQEEDRRTLDEALEILADRYDAETDMGVVLSSEGWHPGVIGIVASRLVEFIHRPVVMVAVDGRNARGSARSIPGFHLYEALSECAGHLVRFGGHRQAAGMDLDPAELPAFRQAFNRVARARIGTEELRPVLRPDLEVSLKDVDLQLEHWLSYLGPHGIGNPGPLFLARKVSLERPRVVGENHLKGELTTEAGRLDAIGFGFAERHPPGSLRRKPLDVVFRLERNEWRGLARAQARIVDLRPASDLP